MGGSEHLTVFSISIYLSFSIFSANVLTINFLTPSHKTALKYLFLKIFTFKKILFIN